MYWPYEAVPRPNLWTHPAQPARRARTRSRTTAGAA